MLIINWFPDSLVLVCKTVIQALGRRRNQVERMILRGRERWRILILVRELVKIPIGEWYSRGKYSWASKKVSLYPVVYINSNHCYLFYDFIWRTWTCILMQCSKYLLSFYNAEGWNVSRRELKHNLHIFVIRNWKSPGHCWCFWTFR